MWREGKEEVYNTVRHFFYSCRIGKLVRGSAVRGEKTAEGS